MKNGCRLSLPTGYRMIEGKEEMTLWQAKERLLTDKIKKYICAVRREDRATLYARYLECPYCGKRVPANTLSPLLVPGRYGRGHRRPRTEVQQWADLQLSFFPEEGQSVLTLAQPLEPEGTFLCPECGKKSTASLGNRQVEIFRRKKKVFLKCQVMDIGEVLGLQWLQTGQLKLQFPLFEVAVFDLHRGAIYVRMEGRDGTVLACRDVTEQPQLLRGGAVEKALQVNRKTLRLLKGCFQKIWGTPLPFFGKSFDVSALIKTTRFVGYPASFYHSIPFDRGTLCLDKSMGKRGKRMHYAACVPAVYEQLGLPEMKSVRRTVFENPGLLFYGEEILRLWTLFFDPNLMCSFLRGRNAFQVLATVNLWPGVMEYLEDYAAVRGPAKLLEEIGTHWTEVRNRAERYAAMGPRMRSEMRAQWTEGNRPEGPAYWQMPVSLPVVCPQSRFPECVIDGYHFCWLQSSNELIRAGRELKNCLTEWQHGPTDVLAVKKMGKFVAAIELDQTTAVQIRGIGNGLVENDPALQHAIESWMYRYGVTADTDWDE